MVPMEFDHLRHVPRLAPTLAPTVTPDPIVLNGTGTASANPADGLSGIASQGCAALEPRRWAARPWPARPPSWPATAPAPLPVDVGDGTPHSILVRFN